MATTSLTINNELLTTTAFNYAKEMRSSHHRPYVVCDHLLGPGMVKDEGGERMIVAWDFGEHSLPTRIVHGYETYNNTLVSIGTPGHDGWAYVVQPTYYSRRDEMINRGQAKRLDMWKIRVKNVEDAMRRDWSRAFLRGAAASGTWNGVPGYEDWNTANGADNTTGFIEAATSGTNTIHNISRSSFTLAAGHFMFHNLYQSGGDSASTNLLIGLYNFLPELKKRVGDINPKDYKAYFTVETLGFLKRALRSAEQYVSDGQMDDGKRIATMYAGIEIVPEDLPSLGSSTTANPWSALFINWAEGMKFHGQSGFVFAQDKVVDVPGTLAKVQLNHLAGQFACEVPGLHALMDNAQAWS